MAPQEESGPAPSGTAMPKVAPESSNNIIAPDFSGAAAVAVRQSPVEGPAEADNNNEQDGPDDFKFEGRRYQLYKRSPGRDAHFYVRVMHDGRRFKKCLETNLRSAAISRAKDWLAKVLHEKWEDVEKLKARQAVATVGEILPVYDRFAAISEKSMVNNKWAFKKVVRMALGRAVDASVDSVPLDKLNHLLVLDFERAMANEYAAKAAKDEASQRCARLKGLRVALSCMRQARSLFNTAKELPRRYEEAGLKIPEKGLAEFMKCKLQGKDEKEDYFQPADDVAAKALEEIATLKEADPQVFKAFWLAVGVGLRRGEIARARKEHFEQRGAEVWYRGGIGKNNRVIDVPVQPRAWAALREFVEGQEGPVLDPDASMQFARRIGTWMAQKGWKTEKKLHELRAYVGSLIYVESAEAARRFMRHKTIKTTERHYARYGSVETPSVL